MLPVTNILVEVHFINVLGVFLAASVSAVTGWIYYYLKRNMNGFLRWSFIVTVIVTLLQAFLGVLLVLLGEKPDGGSNLYYLHYMYGGIAAISIPFVYWYMLKKNEPRRNLLLLNIATTLLIIVAIRAFMTGPGPH